MACYGTYSPKRTYHETTIAVLNATMNGSKKFNIAHATRLNSKNVKKYIDKLVVEGMVERNDDGAYVTTDKGKQFVVHESVYEKYPWLIDVLPHTIYGIFVQLALGEEKNIDPRDYFNSVVKLHAAKNNMSSEKAEEEVFCSLIVYAGHFDESIQIKKYWLEHI